MGRPREFCADKALGEALRLFWRKGYEGTSLTDLTEAMGVTRPSLYATFGNKEDLFHKALDLYNRAYLNFMGPALEEPRSRDVVARLLTGFADAQSDPANPPGCFSTNAALACSEAAEPIRQELVARRARGETALRERLERAKDEGDLPADADPADLARYVMTMAQGMAVQAKAGASRADLHRVVEMALRAWPQA
jgi:AcrR family transcriptional regulator